MWLRRVVDLAVPVSVAAIAFLHAHAIGSLVDVAVAPASVAPFAEARAAAPPTSPVSTSRRSASTILAHNPFDHTAVLATDAPASAEDNSDPFGAPPCDGVRATVSVQMADKLASFAALHVTPVDGRRGSAEGGTRDVSGKRLLQKTGGNVDEDRRVVYVAADRVWLKQGGKLCVARVFAQPPPSSARSEGASSGPQQTALEKEITKRIARTGPNEFQIDRGAVDRLLEAQAELMKTPVVPEKEGDRVVGFRLVRVNPGSVLSALGIESGDRLVSINGIDVTSTERMFEAYARLRTGTIERLTVNVVRNGKPTNLDYVVR